MTIEKKGENAKVTSVTNLVNKIIDGNADIHLNNELLSIILGNLITLAEQGQPPDKVTQTYLMEKSLDTTKADPYIDEDDPLLEIVQFITYTDLLPTKNNQLDMLLLKVFAGEYFGSSRRANRAMYKSTEHYGHKILSSKGFVDLDLMIPSDNAIEQEKRRRSKKNRPSYEEEH